jgi:hypothetical protein
MEIVDGFLWTVWHEFIWRNGAQGWRVVLGERVCISHGGTE